MIQSIFFILVNTLILVGCLYLMSGGWDSRPNFNIVTQVDLNKSFEKCDYSLDDLDMAYSREAMDLGSAMPSREEFFVYETCESSDGKFKSTNAKLHCFEKNGGMLTVMLHGRGHSLEDLRLFVAEMRAEHDASLNVDS